MNEKLELYTEFLFKKHNNAQQQQQTTTKMSLEQQLMSVIDQHKSEMPEGAYLELCNVAKAVHEAGAGAGPTKNLFVVQYHEYTNIQLQQGFLCERELYFGDAEHLQTRIMLLGTFILIIVVPNGTTTFCPRSRMRVRVRMLLRFFHNRAKCFICPMCGPRSMARSLKTVR